MCHWEFPTAALNFNRFDSLEAVADRWSSLSHFLTPLKIGIDGLLERHRKTIENLRQAHRSTVQLLNNFINARSGWSLHE